MVVRAGSPLRMRWIWDLLIPLASASCPVRIPAFVIVASSQSGAKMSSMQNAIPHLCGIASHLHNAPRIYEAQTKVIPMRNRQNAIVEWMQSVIDRRRISATAWATKAKLGKDTVTRAMRPGYEHVTSTTTIAKLAECLGEPLPGGVSPIPSAASLAGIVAELSQDLLGATPMSAELSLLFAESLRDMLLHLEAEPEALEDPRVARALVRASIRQRRPQTSK